MAGKNDCLMPSYSKVSHLLHIVVVVGIVVEGKLSAGEGHAVGEH